MTVKEEVEQLKKELKDLKKEIRTQNNRWNKIYTVSSVVSALAAVINLIIA